MTHSNASLDNEQSMVQSTELVLDVEDENRDSVLKLENVGPPPVILPRERRIHKIKGKPA